MVTVSKAKRLENEKKDLEARSRTPEEQKRLNKITSDLNRFYLQQKKNKGKHPSKESYGTKTR